MPHYCSLKNVCSELGSPTEPNEILVYSTSVQHFPQPLNQLCGPQGQGTGAPCLRTSGLKALSPAFAGCFSYYCKAGGKKGLYIPAPERGATREGEIKKEMWQEGPGKNKLKILVEYGSAGFAFSTGWGECGGKGSWRVFKAQTWRRWREETHPSPLLDTQPLLVLQLM